VPIVDIEFVAWPKDPIQDVSAQAWADTLARVFATPPGRTWVRLRHLDAAAYAENDAPIAADAGPVFVHVLLARWPDEPALLEQMSAITAAVAGLSGRPADRVHVQYLPPAAGRQAFGGQWVK
jgi:hypothetical protein